MSVTNVNSGTAASSTSTTRTTGSDMGKDAFLQLLVAQVSNQDPLEPTSDTEFVAQLAQFSTLEQMQNLNESMTTQQANDMIGMDVTATSVLDVTTGSTVNSEVYGNVVGTTTINGASYLIVNDYNSGSQVYVPTSGVSTLTKSATASTTDQYLALISSWLQQIASNTSATTTTEEDDETAVEEATSAANTQTTTEEDAAQEAEQTATTVSETQDANGTNSIWE